MTIDEVFREFEKFSNDMIDLPPGIGREVIEAFETKISLKLPEDFKAVLYKYNGVTIMGDGFYGFAIPPEMFGLEQLYHFEHYETNNDMPLHLVPFAADGFGNHYCFDTTLINESSCPVVFWQHDCLYSAEDEPEVTNTNFIDWVREVMIEWTLEDTNYDGTQKD